MVFPITEHGYNKLVAELKHLKEVERPENIRDIDTARSHGDLKENAEYHAAREKQRFLDKKIGELGDMLVNAQIIDIASLPHDKVGFGSTVEIVDVDTDEEFVYTIVGSYESNPDKSLISFSSPMAKALIGKSVGDQAVLKHQDKTFDIEEVYYKEIKW